MTAPIRCIPNPTHEAACIQAIRARRLREGMGQIVHAPSDRIGFYLARAKSHGGPVGRLAKLAMAQIEEEM